MRSSPFSALAILLVACTNPEGEIPRASYSADWDAKTEAPEWSSWTLAALRTHGDGLRSSEPTDAARYCPNYSALDEQERDAFWLGLISAMARFESSFKPETQYQERFVDNRSKPVISRGLLQISKESANGRRYRCGIGDATELHDPETNLSCGVKIISALVSRDNVIGVKKNLNWQGGAAYWSVLRSTSGSNPKIRAYTSNLDVCTKL